MKSERGFFTLIGICILLIAAIFVKGIQESELNYAYIARDFKTEMELQNAADSALIEAVHLIRNNTVILQEALPFTFHDSNQHRILEKNFEDIKVEVWYEYGKDSGGGKFHFMERNYSQEKDVEVGEQNKRGVILISVASRASDIMSGKVFARAIGYIFTDGDENILDKEGKPKNYVHFMNSLSSDFK